MVELIAGVIFLGSAAGIITIAARRMPSAKQASERAGGLKSANLWPEFGTWLAARIKKIPYLKEFSWMDFLQKQLLKVKLVVLKAENKINDYMVKLRQRAEDQQKKDEALLDNYWKDLKTIVKTKKPLYAGKQSRGETDHGSGAAALAVAGQPEAEAADDNRGAGDASSKVMPQKRKNQKKKKKFRDPFQW